MKHKVTLTITSLLSILFFAFHWADDIVRGMFGRGLRPWPGAHPGRLAVRNAGARRTPIGVHHHAPRVAWWIGHPCPPHEGSGTCLYFAPLKNKAIDVSYPAMRWIKWTGKTLEFVGKLAQTDSFQKWAESKGETIIRDLGVKTGGYIFGMGKNRRAKNLIWNELSILAKNSPELVSAINDFATHYPDALDALASKYDKLPYNSVYLTVVPRYLVNRDALIQAKKQLGNSKELAQLKGGQALRDYFLDELICQIDMAFAASAIKASSDNPLQLNDKWVVGFNPKYEWKQELGHYFVYSNHSKTRQDAEKQRRKEGKEEAGELLSKTPYLARNALSGSARTVRSQISLILTIKISQWPGSTHGGQPRRAANIYVPLMHEY